MTEGCRGLAWCLGRPKRAFDILAAALGLVVLAPLLALVVVAIALSMGRPILFAQDRVGRGGRLFRLLKFRTMRDGERGPGITGRGDRRVTRAGRLLRAAKLDELPQLVNVLRGEMSVVGPRPEVPRYVPAYTPEQRRVLLVRPGLTDPATLCYRHEEAILGGVPEDRREDFYVQDLMPRKLALNLEYLERASPVRDLGLIVRTLLALPDVRRG